MILTPFIEAIQSFWRKLLSISVTLDSEVTDESILGQLLTISDVSDYDREKHSLEAISTLGRDDTSYLEDGITGAPTMTELSTADTWTQLIASLSADRSLSNVCVGVSDPTQLVPFTIKIGVGVASSETPIFEHDFRIANGRSTFDFPVAPMKDIAAGTRISARFESSYTDTVWIGLTFMDFGS